jgi:hypothetical protein
LRLFDEYRFLDKQLSYIGEMSKEAAPYFEEYYRDYCNRVGVDLPTDDEDEESEESEWDDEEEDSTEEAEEMGAEVSLYEGELPEEDDEEEGEGEFEIELPKNYKQMSRWISKEIKKLRRQVQAKQRTYNYMFSELETDEQRDNLIRKFLNQLFGIVVPIGG